MKNRALRLTVCLLMLLAVPGALLTAAFAVPAQYGETYLAALGDKWARLGETASPRIVVAGGSGVCFDLRCDLLEQELPEYRAVNFGLYAGLGTTVMAELALPLLREGDILIFQPELNAQTYSAYFNAESMWQAADGCPALLFALPRHLAGAMTGALPAFAAGKARLFLTDSAPTGEGVYARRAFNARGDIAAAGRGQNRMARGWDENMPLRLDPALPTADFLDAVNAAARCCAEKGVRFFFRFCPMNAAALAPEEAARLAAFEESLAARLDCPILGSLDGAVMEAGWFFDTNFHLNASGAVVATAALARDLKATLGIDSPVAIPLPPMPEAETAGLTDGDDRDEMCFRYAENGAGFLAVGLTDSGAAKTALTLPVSHDGRPVSGFSAEAFAGNTVLETLTIQANVRSIPDGAFSGCTALRRIILRQTTPSGCTVGGGLLEGTEALVYVPAGSLSAYCTDYFWSVHAARLRAE